MRGFEIMEYLIGTYMGTSTKSSPAALGTETILNIIPFRFTVDMFQIYPFQFYPFLSQF